MKIDIRLLSECDPVILEDENSPQDLDLDVPGVKLISGARIKARVVKIPEGEQCVVAMDVHLEVSYLMQCSRCLEEISAWINKDFHLDYPCDSPEEIIDITEDIRQEIMFAYPVQPLCKESCKGLCQKCGKNLNEGNCLCKSSQ